jgi:ATP-dependent Clp protease ATP-binding subunit ClpA
MALANQEAQRLNHEYIGTEHILLGLVKEGSGVGATVLKNLDIDIKKLRLEVGKLVKSGPDMVVMGKLPQSPRAKKVIEYAIEESRCLHHDYIGTEHILLGLLRDSEGIAAQVLMNLGLKLEDVRQEVLNLLGAGAAASGMKMGPIVGRKPKSKMLSLDSPGRDLTQLPADTELNRKNKIDRFTDRARKVMALANQEAQRFNHEYIGTEHILLGLVKEGSGVGATILKNLDVDIKKLRLEVERLIKRGPDMVTMGKLPQTPRAKKVIQYAIEEACLLKRDCVGTEHILLGLLRDSEGIAAQDLMNLGLKLEDVRQEVLNLLGAGVDDGPAALGMKMSPTEGRKPKSEGQRSRASIVHAIPENRMTWVKCLNDKCQAEYQIGLRGYVRYVEANFNPMLPHAPTLTCEKCGEQSILRALKCTNIACGKVFIISAFSDVLDRCPECGHSDVEEKRKRHRDSRG